MTNSTLNRRETIAALLAIASASALSACGSSVEEGGTADVSVAFGNGAEFFSADEMALVAAIADTIIPDTDTGGAVAAGVPAVIQGLVSDWGDDVYRKYMRGGLAKLGGNLQREAGQPFANLNAARRENLLGKVDAAAFSEAGFEDEAQTDFYKAFKTTVATAYYMSEIGATEELAYEAVPGEWIGDAPLSEFPKTWAT